MPGTITLARESRGWTQRELAAAINLKQSALAKYELGVLRIPAHHLAAIADVLDYDEGLFQMDSPILKLGGDFLYRRRARVASRVKRRVEAHANVLRLQVERLLQKVEVQHEDFPFPAIQPEEVNGRIDRIAQEVRHAFRLPDGPVQNVTGAIERAGGIVFTIDFETDLIDGTNLRMPGLPPMLFLNEKVAGERHRFNLAHELGHAVMHFTLSLDDAEEQANAFASEFLMPRSLIRSDLRNLDLNAALRLKAVWGVSMAAIIRRAYDLEVITESQYRRLFTALGARDMRSHEPMPIEFESPEVFDRMIAALREEYEMSDSEVRKVLFTNRLGPMPLPAKPRRRSSDESASLFDTPTLKFPRNP